MAIVFTREKIRVTQVAEGMATRASARVHETQVSKGMTMRASASLGGSNRAGIERFFPTLNWLRPIYI